MEDPRTLAATDAQPLVPGQRSLWSIFTRRLWVIATVAVGVFASAAVVGLVQPRVYRATAVVLLSEPREARSSEMSIETPAEIFERVESELPVQLRLVRSTSIAEKVKAALKLEMAAEELLDSTSVSRLTGTQKTNLLALSSDGTDPARCRDIANQWAEVYSEESRARSGRSVDAALEYITEQLETVEGQLDDVEQRLAGVQDGRGSLDGMVATDDPASELEAKVDDNLARQAGLRAKAGEAAALLAREPELKAETREEPTASAQAVKGELARLTLQRQQMLESYREDTPEIRGLDERIGRLERQLTSVGRQTRTVTAKVPNEARTDLRRQVGDLQAELAAAQAEGAQLQQQLTEAHGASPEQTAAKVDFARLRRSQRVLEETHSMLLTRQYELRLQKEMEAPTVQIVQAADLPTVPIKPQLQTLLGLGLALGLLLGVTAAVVVDQIADTFADVDEIASYTGLRLLGVLPYFKDIQASPLVAAEHTRSGFANASRMLVSNLRFLRARDGSSSIVVTSAGRSEGKTTATINLAIALAAAGEEVLVVDADLHRPGIHRAFGITNEVGLSNVLVGSRPIEEATQPTAVERVSVMASGPLPPSPTDLLASEETVEVIRRINQSADIVIWDTPPSGLLPDASIIAGHTDALIYVVGRDAKRRMVKQTLTHLQAAGVEALGVVANQTRPRGGYYYYYQYYQYYHSYYSEDEKG